MTIYRVSEKTAVGGDDGLCDQIRKKGLRRNSAHQVARHRKRWTKSPEERLKARNLRSRPVAEGFRKWLDEMSTAVLPKSLFGVAVNYGRQQ